MSARRFYVQRADWRMVEVLPRIRLYFSEHGAGNVGIGFGWLVFWAHVWLRKPS